MRRYAIATAILFVLMWIGVEIQTLQLCGAICWHRIPNLTCGSGYNLAVTQLVSECPYSHFVSIEKGLMVLKKSYSRSGLRRALNCYPIPDAVEHEDRERGAPTYSCGFRYQYLHYTYGCCTCCLHVCVRYIDPGPDPSLRGKDLTVLRSSPCNPISVILGCGLLTRV